jgi:hypothetical protein
MNILRWLIADPSFFAKIDMTGSCWQWKGASSKRGYGFVTRHQKTYVAHRYMWLLWTGADAPAGMDLCHRCDNKLCVRPSHLFVGTRSENMLDAKSKGLLGYQKHPERIPRGPRHGRITKPEAWVRS